MSLPHRSTCLCAVALLALLSAHPVCAQNLAYSIKGVNLSGLSAKTIGADWKLLVRSHRINADIDEEFLIAFGRLQPKQTLLEIPQTPAEASRAKDIATIAMNSTLYSNPRLVFYGTQTIPNPYYVPGRNTSRPPGSSGPHPPSPDSSPTARIPLDLKTPSLPVDASAFKAALAGKGVLVSVANGVITWQVQN